MKPHLTKLDMVKIIMLVVNMMISGMLLIILTLYSEDNTNQRLVVFLIGIIMGHLTVKVTTLGFTVFATYMSPAKDIVDRMANIVSLFGFLLATMLYFTNIESQLLLYGFGIYMLLNLYSIASRLLRWSILAHFGFEVAHQEQH